MRSFACFVLSQLFRLFTAGIVGAAVAFPFQLVGWDGVLADQHLVCWYWLLLLYLRVLYLVLIKAYHCYRNASGHWPRPTLGNKEGPKDWQLCLLFAWHYHAPGFATVSENHDASGDEVNVSKGDVVLVLEQAAQDESESSTCCLVRNLTTREEGLCPASKLDLKPLKGQAIPHLGIPVLGQLAGLLDGALVWTHYTQLHRRINPDRMHPWTEFNLFWALLYAFVAWQWLGNEAFALAVATVRHAVTGTMAGSTESTPSSITWFAIGLILCIQVTVTTFLARAREFEINRHLDTGTVMDPSDPSYLWTGKLLQRCLNTFDRYTSSIVVHSCTFGASSRESAGQIKEDANEPNVISCSSQHGLRMINFYFQVFAVFGGLLVPALGVRLALGMLAARHASIPFMFLGIFGHSQCVLLAARLLCYLFRPEASIVQRRPTSAMFIVGFLDVTLVLFFAGTAGTLIYACGSVLLTRLQLYFSPSRYPKGRMQDPDETPPTSDPPVGQQALSANHHGDEPWPSVALKSSWGFTLLLLKQANPDPLRDGARSHRHPMNRYFFVILGIIATVVVFFADMSGVVGAAILQPAWRFLKRWVLTPFYNSWGENPGLAAKVLLLMRSVLVSVCVVALVYVAIPPGRGVCPLAAGRRDASFPEFNVSGIPVPIKSKNDRLEFDRQLGCLKGNLRVVDGLPELYQHGVFSLENSGKTLPVLLRLAGDRLNADDSALEQRGLSVKVGHLRGVELDGQTTVFNATQDFLLSSFESAFFDQVDQYQSLMALRAKDGSLLAWSAGLHDPRAGPSPDFWNPFTWQVFSFFRFSRLTRRTSDMLNPLFWHYSSITPFRVGPDVAARFHVRPCPGRVDLKVLERAWRATRERHPRSFLQTNLEELLEHGKDDVCLELLIQPQRDPCEENLEAHLTPWESPLIKAAELTIPRQVYTTYHRHRRCENASFDVWRGLEAHRPLGELNKLRRSAYTKWRENRLVEEVVFPREGWGDNLQNYSVDQKKYDSSTPCAECCLDRSPCHYERMAHPFDDLPSKVAASSAFSTAKLFSMEKNRRLLRWVPPRVYTAAFGKAVRRILTPVVNIVRDISSWLLPVSWPWHLEPNKYTDMWLPPDNRARDQRIGYRNMPLLDKARATTIWDQDWFFAHQFVGGINPMMIVKARPLTECVEGEACRDCQIRCLPAIFNTSAVDRYLQRLAKATRLTEQEHRETPTVASLASEGRLFFADYHVLEGVPFKSGTMLYKPICVFWAPGNASARLMPLAIQLTRLVGRINKLYVPGDSDKSEPNWEWMLAKAHVLQSDSVVHQAVVHLAYTHLAAEPYLVAFARQLPPGDQLRQVMQRHFVDTLAINELGRRTLVSKKGQFEAITSLGLNGTLSLMQTSYRFHSILRPDAGWSIEDFSFPRNMALRGFDRTCNKGTAKYFHYCEDGYRMWDIIELYAALHLSKKFRRCRKHVEQLLAAKKTTEEGIPWGHRGVAKEHEITCSNELQASLQLKKLRAELQSSDQANLPGMVPEFYQSFHETVTFMATLIFHLSAQHSAVNDGQYHWYAHIPARPLLLRREMPHDFAVDEAYFWSAFPSMETAASTVDIVHIVSMYPDETIHSLVLQDAKDHRCTSRFELCDRVLQKGFDHLKHMVQEFGYHVERHVEHASGNRSHGIPYPYLHPRNTAASIAI